MSRPMSRPMSRDHNTCEPFLRDQLQQGFRETRAAHPEWPDTGRDEVDIHVTTAPPVVPSPWTAAVTCPHGTTFYMEPTGEQLAEWSRVQMP